MSRTMPLVRGWVSTQAYERTTPPLPPAGEGSMVRNISL